MRSLLATLGVIVVCSAAHAQSFEKARLAWNLPWDADWVTAVCFVGNGKVAAGNNLGDILVWDLPAAAPEKVEKSDKGDKKGDKDKNPGPPPVRRLAHHTNVINRLLITPDQRWLISASNDKTIAYWDMQAEAKDAETVVLNSRAIDEAARRKQKAPPPREAKVLTQKPAQVLTGHRDWVLGLSMTRDGNTLLSGDDKGEVIVWDRAAAKEVRRWKVKGWAWAVAVSPEGQTALVSERLPLIFDSGRHSGLKLWNAQTGELKVDLAKDDKEGKEFKNIMSAAAFSPDGKHLAVGRGGELDGTNGKVFLLDPQTGKKVRELTPGHLNGLTDIAFHPDGKHVFSVGRDTVVKIWKLEDGKLVRDLGTPRGGQFKDWLHSISISPDGNWLAAGDMMGQVQVWSLGGS